MEKIVSINQSVYARTGMSVAMILFWLLISAAAFWSYHSQLDVTVTHYFMTEHSDRWKQDIFGYLSRMGQGWFQVLVCCTLGYVYYRKGMIIHSRAWFLAMPIFLYVGIIGFFFKVLFGRPRPKMLEQMYDFQWLEWPSRMHAFPSGHTLTTFALLGSVVWLYPRAGQAVLWLIACVLASARVGIGSHWLGDILMGAALGYCLASFFKRKMKLEKPEYVFESE